MRSLNSWFGSDAGVLREKNFQILLLISGAGAMGNGLLSPILDSLIDPMGASIATIGLMISVFWIPSVVIIPIVGMLADRYGRKPILAPSLFLYGLSGAMIALTTEFWMALSLRLIQGIGWAGLTSLIVTSIGDFYIGSAETTAQGLRQSGTAVSGGVVSLIAALLVVVAWQYPFLLYLLTVPIAVSVYMWFDEPTDNDGNHAGNRHNTSLYGRELFRLARKRHVLMILLARPLPVVIFIGFISYNSVIVVHLLDGTPTQAGVLFALLSVSLAVAASQVGRVSALMGDRYRTLLGANVCLGAGLLLVFFAPNFLIAGIGALIVGIGFGIYLPVYRTLITGFAPSSLRGGLVSLGSTGGRIGGIVTPVAMGGAIAILTPIFGFASAIQFTGLGIAILGGGGGIAFVLAARTSAQS